MSEKIIGIMAAMPEEIDGVVKLIQQPQELLIGGRVYTKGIIAGKQVVVVFSRWGKVAAASTATTLIDVFNVNQIFFTGIAGGIHDDIKVGDIVIASSCVFHDMDTRPLNDRFVVPLINQKFFELPITESLIRKLEYQFSSNNMHKIVALDWIDYFDLTNVKIFHRVIASGDQFINSELTKNDLRINLPEVACVEMEGAAVAQVCFEHDVPCMIVRTISDSANHSAATDFEPFAKHVASHYSVAIIEVLISD
ncbi:MAG: 5'-methylthioadenosine/adenosylhomocysteine nucleosidase [Bacteroidota bacterium]